MKKTLIVGILIIAALGPVGCTSSTLDKEAQNAVSQLSAAATKISNIAAAVRDAVKTAEAGKSDKSKKLDFKKAKKELESLGKTAETLLGIDNKLPRKELTAEQKTELKKQLGSQVEPALLRVAKASDELTKALEKANAIDEKSTEEFVTELTSTLNLFTQIATRHE